MAPRTPSTRRSVSTSSVLGKRPASTSAPPTDESNLTPESTPRMKRRCLVKAVEEENGGEEKIPPMPSIDEEVETPTKARPTQGRNHHQQPSPSQAIATPQRISRTQIPAISINRLTPATPPATPAATCSLYARVRSLLRTTCNSSVSMSRNGRERELQIIENFLSCFDSDSSKVNEPVSYISGSPGTGKTALVHSIHTSIARSSKTRFVFVNCMAFNRVNDLWECLGEEIFGPIPKGGRKTKRVYDKELVTANACARTISTWNSHSETDSDPLLHVEMNVSPPTPGDEVKSDKSMKCIVILDEVDSLSSDISLQTLIHLSVRLRHTIRLLGIANTHTLSSTSVLLPFALESSAEYIKTLHFAPYTFSQLLAILETRLKPIPHDELKKMLPTAVLTLLAKKLAALTGDVRVLFEVLGCTIDTAVSSSPESALSRKPNASVSVTPKHVLSALKSYSPASLPSSPTKVTSNKTSISETVTNVRKLGLQSRLVLFALLVAFKRLSLSLPLFTFSSSTPPSPAKKLPMKRSQSASSIPFPPASSTQSLNAVQLHSFYNSVLHSAGTFTPVSRSEFTDLLGLLEANGLISLSSPSSSGGGARAFKRDSFTGRGKARGGAGQCIRLQSGVREKELARGLGIDVDVNTAASGAPKSRTRTPEVEVAVIEEEVREICYSEVAKMRRELKARVRAINEAEKDWEKEIGFED